MKSSHYRTLSLTRTSGIVFPIQYLILFLRYFSFVQNASTSSCCQSSETTITDEKNKALVIYDIVPFDHNREESKIQRLDLCNDLLLFDYHLVKELVIQDTYQTLQHVKGRNWDISEHDKYDYLEMIGSSLLKFIQLKIPNFDKEIFSSQVNFQPFISVSMKKKANK